MAARATWRAVARRTAVALRGGIPGRPPDPAAGVGPDAAPVVVASGQGYVAEQIIALAKAYGVPVERDPALAGMLARLRVGEAIPPELYQAIAELLVFLYDLDARVVQ